MRAFLGRSVPVWEGHTRDGLPRLVTACVAGRGNPIAIAGAFTDFVQFVCKGFGDSAFADLLRAEVAAGAVKQRAGKPAQLQALARLILVSPDHVGIARALELLVALKDNHPHFAEIEIDLRREFREAMQLAAFAACLGVERDHPATRGSAEQYAFKVHQHRSQGQGTGGGSCGAGALRQGSFRRCRRETLPSVCRAQQGKKVPDGRGSDVYAQSLAHLSMTQAQTRGVLQIEALARFHQIFCKLPIATFLSR